MSDVLVDSSVWVGFFRGEKAAMDRLDRLLADDRAALSGPVFAELTSGARSMASFHDLRRRLGAVHRLADPADLWERVAEARFNLARQGVQAHLVDLTIAITASFHGHALLTRDRDFEAIAKVVPVDLERF